MARYYLSAATADDFDFVYELKKIAYREYIEQTWGWDDIFQLKFQQESFSAGNTKLIKANEQPIGSVDVKEGDTNIFISGLYILPQFQSKGIGTVIIKDLIKQAEAKKKRLELEVLRVNAKALKLYQRLGFVTEEGDKTKYFLYKEVGSDLEKDEVSDIQIIDFKDDFVEDFAALNRAWLQKYFVVEPIDETIFANPREYIIENRGYIFFAKLNGQIAGTFALMNMEEGVYELSKMAVAEEFQGKKIGNKIIEYSLQKAKELEAHKVVLYSNTLLQPAIHLYKKFGFREVPLDAVEYKRANIKMEINIK